MRKNHKDHSHEANALICEKWEVKALQGWSTLKLSEALDGSFPTPCD